MPGKFSTQVRAQSKLRASASGVTLNFEVKAVPKLRHADLVSKQVLIASYYLYVSYKCTNVAKTFFHFCALQNNFRFLLTWLKLLRELRGKK